MGNLAFCKTSEKETPFLWKCDWERLAFAHFKKVTFICKRNKQRQRDKDSSRDIPLCEKEKKKYLRISKDTSISGGQQRNLGICLFYGHHTGQKAQRYSEELESFRRTTCSPFLESIYLHNLNCRATSYYLQINLSMPYPPHMQTGYQYSQGKSSMR